MGEPCSNCGVRHRTKTSEQCADEKMLEKVLQRRIVDRAKRLGWKTAHAGKGFIEGAGWVTQMSPGWPDLTLAKAGHRLLFFELKKELEEPDPEQQDWLVLLNACGARATVVKPSDLREGRVNIILREGSPL